MTPAAGPVVVVDTGGAEGRAALAAGRAAADERGMPLVVVQAAIVPTAAADRVVDPDEPGAISAAIRDASLVVVGLRQREGAARFVLATPAMRVVLGSEAPVLVARP
ncbi:universal stress protein [Microbacterium gilvum]|uniref:UspA domain-containing protein n=1 Tax=Microbacterium gilvum TaxID=1336204 RepID=A0ABP9ABK6_9MICO